MKRIIGLMIVLGLCVSIVTNTFFGYALVSLVREGTITLNGWAWFWGILSALAVVLNATTLYLAIYKDNGETESKQEGGVS